MNNLRYNIIEISLKQMKTQRYMQTNIGLS